MQIWLDVVDPPHQNFMDAFRHVTPLPLQTQQKPRVTEAQHNAEKHFLLLSSLLIMFFTAAASSPLSAPIFINVSAVSGQTPSSNRLWTKEIKQKIYL